MDSGGKAYKGVIAARNESELFTLLYKQSHNLIAYRKVGRTREPFSLRFIAVTRRDLIELCLHLEQMDRAGVSILESLSDAQSTVNNSKLRAVLATVLLNVRAGMLLSEALAQHSKIFDNFFVQVIAISEQTGRLYQGFEKLVGHLKWLDESREQIIKVVRYPAILAVVVIGVLILLLKFLVPQLTEFILSIDSEIPPMTAGLLNVSEVVVLVLPWVILAGLSCFLTILGLRKVFNGFAEVVDRAVFWIPLAGKIYRKIVLSRFIYFYNITFDAGIDTLQCLQLAIQPVTNRYLRSKLLLIKDLVNSGVSLSQAMQMSQVFPSSAAKMVKVGEDTGSLVKVLQNLHYFFERDISRDIERYIRLLEPALLLAIGSVMIWIILGVFYPVYDHLTVMDY